LIDSYYRPHHRLLTNLTRQAIADNGHCLIIDGHSFPLHPLPYEMDHSLERPELCIGTDDYHTPDDLRDTAVKLFQEAGFTVAVNSPFAGALVPMEFYRCDKRVMGLMIEVRRDLYMEEATAKKSPNFDAARDKIRNVIAELVIYAEDSLIQ
jgi:N-formylglutamate amidohydrolase